MSLKNVPLIELRGFSKKNANAFITQFKQAIEPELKKNDFKHLLFEIIPSTVVDINNKPRPYLRLLSRDFVLFHTIIECLRSMKWEGEIDSVMLQNYQDLRPQKS